MASDRHKKLDESNALHQFYRDVDDEESWIKWVACSLISLSAFNLTCSNFSFCLIREKKLLTSSEDYGKDLTGVQNLRKKHQRLEAELNTHEARIQVRSHKHLNSHLSMAADISFNVWRIGFTIMFFFYRLCWHVAVNLSMRDIAVQMTSRLAVTSWRKTGMSWKILQNRDNTNWSSLLLISSLVQMLVKRNLGSTRRTLLLEAMTMAIHWLQFRWGNCPMWFIA